MSIDWITVSAQIINFLILVWLLKRFLYQPVMSAMESREQRIAEQLNKAQAREQKADEKAQHYQEKTAELQCKRDETLAKAREEAEQYKRQLFDEARTEVAETRAHWQRQAQQEKEEFSGNLRHRTSDVIQVIARKALTDLAEIDLEEQIIQSFIHRLKSLDKDSHKTLLGTSESVRIASAFELNSAMRGRLTRAVHEHLVDGIDVEFIKSPELLCGIELVAGDGRLSWNLANYLEELSERVEEAFASAIPTEKAKE